MPKVLLFIEGEAPPGGLKEGFRVFFQELNDLLPDGWSFEPIPGGGWRQTFKMYRTALETNENDFVVLIIDSADPVPDIEQPWNFLSQKRGWDVTEFNNNQCYLMIQTMEAWFLADIEKTEEVFGEGFERNRINHPDGIESLSPATLEIQLKTASRHSEKSKFRKGMAYQILEAIRPDVVREALAHCDRIFTEIPKAIEKL